MYRLSFAVLCMSVVMGVQAQTTIKSSNRQLNIGTGHQRISYIERDNYGITADGVLDGEKGSQPAAKASYTIQDDVGGISDVYFKAAVAYARGKTHYTGYLQNLSTGALTPYNTETHTSTFDVEMRLGKGFGLANRKVQLTPYIEYGYHEWERDLSFDPFGYLEVYEHHYVAAGLLAQVAITQNLVASVEASIGRTINAQMTVEHVLEFGLGSKPIRSFGFGFDYALPAEWHLNGSYRMTRYSYGQSPVVSGFYEPESKTTLQNLFVTVGRSF